MPSPRTSAWHQCRANRATASAVGRRSGTTATADCARRCTWPRSAPPATIRRSSRSTSACAWPASPSRSPVVPPHASCSIRPGRPGPNGSASTRTINNNNMPPHPSSSLDNAMPYLLHPSTRVRPGRMVTRHDESRGAGHPRLGEGPHALCPHLAAAQAVFSPGWLGPSLRRGRAWLKYATYVRSTHRRCASPRIRRWSKQARCPLPRKRPYVALAREWARVGPESCSRRRGGRIPAHTCYRCRGSGTVGLPERRGLAQQLRHPSICAVPCDATMDLSWLNIHPGRRGPASGTCAAW